VLKFNPTSRLLISGSADNTVRLIAIPDGLGDSSAFYPHVILYRIGFMVYLLFSASWSYVLLIIFALFLVLFAVAYQLLMSGAI
jgi:prolactin regulatory element-binding protein